MIYMATADTTTIRIRTETRDRLKVLAARRGESAGDLVSELVADADEQAALDEIEASFEKIASNPRVLAAYRAESHEIEAGFEASAPEW